MQHISIRIIKEEHDSLTAMLQSMLMMIRRGPLNEPELFFDVLRSMLFYIDEVPEKQHHPKESQHFFPLVALRSAACAESIQRLEKEHQHGEAAIRELQHLLLAWEIMGDTAAKPLCRRPKVILISTKRTWRWRKNRSFQRP